MTRKDYIALAASLKSVARFARADSEVTPAEVAALAAEVIADALAADNPRFDRSRFLAACGVAPSRATTGAEG